MDAKEIKRICIEACDDTYEYYDDMQYTDDPKGLSKLRIVDYYVHGSFVNFLMGSKVVDTTNIVLSINGVDYRDEQLNIVSFTNGLVLSPGEVVGSVNFDTLRRLQIRETIKTHIEREQELYLKGIKVLSLFFIDEVAKYRQYDESGNDINGQYGIMFEEEYASVIEEMRPFFNNQYAALWIQ